MYTFNLILLIFGGVSLLLGLSSGVIKNRIYLSEPIIAVLAGILIGPSVFAILSVDQWGDPQFIVMEASRVTLAIALIGVALQLPDHFFSWAWRPVTVLLALVMPFMWLCSGLLSWLFLDVSLLTAMLIGAVVTPTDPVLASSIVTGKIALSRLPENLRHTISAEAGANDALAYPLVMLPILIGQESVTAAMTHFALDIILWQVLGSIVLGALIGFGSGRLLNRLRDSPVADLVSLQTVSLSLALAVAGSVKLIHGEGLLAVFVAGIFLNREITGEFQREKQELIENLKRFLDIPVFILFGMVIPWQAWIDLGWPAVGLAATLLILRRLPAVMLFTPWLATINSRSQSAFMGWFGPIGIAALYYAHLAISKGAETIVWQAGSLIIFVSLIIHGITATPLTKALGRSIT